MESAEFRAYLTLLRACSDTLEQLTKIEQKKTQAVRYDDLSALNETMKEEQALSLRLRGYEQKQQQFLKTLQLTDIPLSRLSERAPAGCAAEAREVAEVFRTQYEQFKSAFEVAQSTLECNLHEVEKILTDMGVDPLEGAGYQGEQGPELPVKMRTDFRA